MYISTKLSEISFEEAIEKVTAELKVENFGILTEIDIKATLKKKLDADFRNYIILGACNPPFAFKALSLNDKIGVLLPCNVIVQELENEVEVFSIDPVVLMAGEENEEVREMAAEISEKLRRVLSAL